MPYEMFKKQGRKSKAWWIQVVKDSAEEPIRRVIAEKAGVAVADTKMALDHLILAGYIKMEKGLNSAGVGRVFKYEVTSFGHRYLNENPGELADAEIDLESEPEDKAADESRPAPVSHGVPVMKPFDGPAEPKRNYGVGAKLERPDNKPDTELRVNPKGEAEDRPVPEARTFTVDPDAVATVVSDKQDEDADGEEWPSDADRPAEVDEAQGRINDGLDKMVDGGNKVLDKAKAAGVVPGYSMMHDKMMADHRTMINQQNADLKQLLLAKVGEILYDKHPDEVTAKELIDRL